MTTRVAAIDCGTNTIRLLIADVDTDGNLTEVARRVEIVRLGEGVDETGMFADQALARTFAMAKEYAELIRESGATKVRFVATSATRDAKNANLLNAGIQSALGVLPEVISGGEEARLSFLGATRAATMPDPQTGKPRCPGPYLVVDLGGGSTELVLGTDAPQESISLNIGSVRLAERFLKHDPPAPWEVAQANANVTAELLKAEAAIDMHLTKTLIGVAGTITTVAALALGLTEYDRDRIHGTQLPILELFQACGTMLQMTIAEREALGIMQPGRADVIAAGALIWAQIVARVRRDVRHVGGSLDTVLISESDLLDGLALDMAD